MPSDHGQLSFVSLLSRLVKACQVQGGFQNNVVAGTLIAMSRDLPLGLGNVGTLCRFEGSTRYK